MAKKSITIEEKIQKLMVIKEMAEYVERQQDYTKQEAESYLEQATDNETGEVNTESWAYSRVQELEAKASAYEDMLSDLEHLV